jgi:hypothetical protein
LSSFKVKYLTFFCRNLENSSYTTAIFRYSISTDSLQLIESLGKNIGGGVAFRSDDGSSIYYVGGWEQPKLIHEFSTITNNTTIQLSSSLLPSPVEEATAVTINKTAFIFNGRYRNILEFDMESDTARIIAELPFWYGKNTVLSTAAIFDGRDSVWLFAGEFQKPHHPILRFNTTSKLVSIPEQDEASKVPTFCCFLAAGSIWDGQDGYILGGIGRTSESDGSYHPTNGILSLSPLLMGIQLSQKLVTTFSQYPIQIQRRKRYNGIPSCCQLPCREQNILG